MKTSKASCISELELCGYTYLGYYECFGGYKAYHFTHPDGHKVSYDLSLLRRVADSEGWKRWSREVDAELRFGIQEELFCDWEIQETYAITNPLPAA